MVVKSALKDEIVMVIVLDLDTIARHATCFDARHMEGGVDGDYDTVVEAFEDLVVAVAVDMYAWRNLDGVEGRMATTMVTAVDAVDSIVGHYPEGSMQFDYRALLPLLRTNEVVVVVVC